MTDERKARVAKNEALFRSLNEQVKEVAEPFLEMSARSETQPIGFVCECGREGLLRDDRAPARRVRAGARAQPDRFVILPGHETPAVERVVSRGDRFWIVEKHAEASRVATAHDPRR